MSDSNEDRLGRQKCFFELKNGASNDNGNGAPACVAKSKKPKAPKEQVIIGEVTALLREELARVNGRLAVIEDLLKWMSERLEATQIVKEYYTTLEVARILQKKPYTVREWCRLGRVNAQKAFSGRGLDEEWRISHDELVRIQNEGLLKTKPETQVRSAGRINKPR